MQHRMIYAIMGLTLCGVLFAGCGKTVEDPFTDGVSYSASSETNVSAPDISFEDKENDPVETDPVTESNTYTQEKEDAAHTEETEEDSAEEYDFAFYGVDDDLPEGFSDEDMELATSDDESSVPDDLAQRLKENEIRQEITDDTGRIDASKANSILTKTNEMSDAFWSEVFNFGPETEDFTEELNRAYFNAEFSAPEFQLENIYTVNKGIGLVSKYKEYKWVSGRFYETEEGQILFQKFGIVSVHFNHDKIKKEGDYEVLVNEVYFVNSDNSIFCVMMKPQYYAPYDSEDSFRIFYKKGNERVERTFLVPEGFKRWDITDPEGFITDYKYNSNNEVIVTENGTIYSENADQEEVPEYIMRDESEISE